MKIKVYERKDSVGSYEVIMPYPTRERGAEKAWAMKFDIFLNPNNRNQTCVGYGRLKVYTPLTQLKGFKREYKSVDTIEYPRWLSPLVSSTQHLWNDICSNHGEAFDALVDSLIEDENEWSKLLAQYY